METGTLIEFKVTPELLSRLGEFIALECQLPQATSSSFATPELLSMHLRDCQTKTSRAVRRLLALLQSQGVPAIDSDIVGEIEKLRICAKENPIDEDAIRKEVVKWLAPHFPGLHPSSVLAFDRGDTTGKKFLGCEGYYIEQLGVTAWIPA